ncbi:MAG TPA: hypothetical protein VEB00_15605 [Clostridia bacterium]|nr:hypothetical protein [Clostridia bacterium]
MNGKTLSEIARIGPPHRVKDYDYKICTGHSGYVVIFASFRNNFLSGVRGTILSIVNYLLLNVEQQFWYIILKINLFKGESKWKSDKPEIYCWRSLGIVQLNFLHLPGFANHLSISLRGGAMILSS